MLHERERDTYGKMDELHATIRDYENKIEALQNQLKRVSENVRGSICYYS